MRHKFIHYKSGFFLSLQIYIGIIIKKYWIILRLNSMKRYNIHIIPGILLLIILGISGSTLMVHADVYLVYYATVGEKPGHCGVAIDNYQFIANSIDTYDTVKTNTLTYYDLWPEKDLHSFNDHHSDQQPHYYRLPEASWQKAITLKSLTNRGLPHKKGYPCDGMLKLSTSPQNDWRLICFMDSVLLEQKAYNTRHFNCSDFSKIAFENVLDKKIDASEFVLTGFSSTPNKLFKQLSKEEGVELLKDPGEKADGTFLKLQILPRFMRKIENIIINIKTII